MRESKGEIGPFSIKTDERTDTGKIVESANLISTSVSDGREMLSCTMSRGAASLHRATRKRG